MLVNVSMVMKIQLGPAGERINQLHGFWVSHSAEYRSLNGPINPWQAHTWRLRKRPSGQFNIGLKNLILHAIRNNHIGKLPIHQERLPLFVHQLHTDDLKNYLEVRVDVDVVGEKVILGVSWVISGRRYDDGPPPWGIMGVKETSP